MPIIKQMIRKNTKSPMLSSMESGEMALPAAATVESTTIMIMPEISSRTRMPKAMGAKACFKRFSSPSVLLTTAVELIVSMQPVKMLSVRLQPSSCAQAKPRQAMPVNSVTAAIMAVLAVLFILLKL